MADDVSRVDDTIMVRAVLERYSRAIDRLDGDLLESCYWADAKVNFGVEEPVANFIQRALPSLRDRYDATMHSLAQSIIEVDADHAYAETYNVAYHRGRDGGRSTLTTVGNRYVDVFHRRDGEWRILHRQVIIEWSKLDADVTITHPVENFPLAHRDRNDPAYRRHAIS